MNQPITIVGGGLAGLTLGIALRQHDVPVTIWEASSYPRHRVCGEFISGRGLETLSRLGLIDRLLDANARWAHTAAIYATGIPPFRHALPQPALCISRYRLDTLLAAEFCQIGGILYEHHRWTGDYMAEGVVRASGHRVEALVDGWRWLGIKVHTHDAVLDADFELHLLPNGYVGLCQLANEINVCGLFRTKDTVPELRSHWKEWLAGAKDSVLQTRLARAVFDEHSFCTVSGLCLKPHRASTEGECVLGDALTMIPPVTGNGMSLAFESAELAAEPLHLYAQGSVSWENVRRKIATLCNRRFAARLRNAAVLNKATFSPIACRILFALLRQGPVGWSTVFGLTR